MATRGGTGTAQRPNGIPREKVCQFKLVLLGKSGEERGGKRRRQWMKGRKLGNWGKKVLMCMYTYMYTSIIMASFMSFRTINLCMYCKHLICVGVLPTWNYPCFLLSCLAPCHIHSLPFSPSTSCTSFLSSSPSLSFSLPPLHPHPHPLSPSPSPSPSPVPSLPLSLPHRWISCRQV